MESVYPPYLALRGHDESDTAENQGIFRGLIKFSAELYATLSKHLKNASILKGTSKEIQNVLLQCMLEVCHEQIIEEINNSQFLAIMADETTDVSAKSQLVLVLRYFRDGDPIERFWNYLIPERCDAETLSKTILSVIDPLIQNSPNKLIAQSYDGAAVMSGQHAGVQALIKKVSVCSLCTLLCPSAKFDYVSSCFCKFANTTPSKIFNKKTI